MVFVNGQIRLKGRKGKTRVLLVPTEPHCWWWWGDLKNIFMSEHFTKSTSGHGTGSLRRGFTGFLNEFATELATSSPARLDPEHVGVRGPCVGGGRQWCPQGYTHPCTREGLLPVHKERVFINEMKTVFVVSTGDPLWCRNICVTPIDVIKRT